MLPSPTLRLLFACALCSTWAAIPARADDERIQFFENRIRPVLVKHCYKCHSKDAKNIRGGLLLDSQEGVADGGESGAAVIPGKPEDSLLVSSLRHDSYEMPPDRKLPDHVVADFEKWIQDGAIDPRRGGTTMTRSTIDLEEGRKFWCFQPLARTEIPIVDGNWPLTPVDAYVAAGHADAKVTPSPDATAEQTVRRLYFALIGLPPQPKDIATFVDAWNRSPDEAVASTADELLQRPEFGERWGRHWLDVTRFAESSGGGRSLMFADAWRFRDYVVQSYNDDKPFDQMIREHIAGDQLPYESDVQHDDQVTGVGYLTLGPTNYEQQDKELLRMEVVDEQVDTVGRTFLALTLGCARCHDHKFDPLPTADYYALAGIFRSTRTLTPGNVSGYVTTNLKAGKIDAKRRHWEDSVGKLRQTIKALQKQLPASARVRKVKEIDSLTLPGIVVDDDDGAFEGTWVHSTSLAPYIDRGYRHDNFVKTGKRVSFTTTLPSDGEYQVRICHNSAPSRCNRLPISIQHANGTTTVEIDQRKAPADQVFAELGTYSFRSDKPAVITIDVENSGAGVVIVDAVQFLPALKTKESVADKSEHTRVLQDIERNERQLTQLEKQEPVVPRAMSVVDEAAPADWHIHVRGGIRNLGDIVPRGFVSVAQSRDYEALSIPKDRSGRFGLANWIASKDNPLTARVYVNRIWLHLIGEGLVRTPDNFGKMGQRPSHPELLDYLTTNFINEDQWSTKALIRRIVTSRVFRMSSSTTEAQQLGDSENRLLTRGFRRRLEAEAIRDSILQISGQLDGDLRGGLTIRKISQYDNAYDHDVLQSNARSVYLPFFRNSMPELFLTFDVANPNLVTGRRSVSTLPTQALFLLNSPYILQQSRLAAEHFLARWSVNRPGIDDMVDDVYQTTLGRMPTNEERLTIVTYLNETAGEEVDAWASTFQALFASMDFRYVD